MTAEDEKSLATYLDDESEIIALRIQIKQLRNSIQQQRQMNQSRVDMWKARYAYTYDQLQQMRSAKRAEEARAVIAAHQESLKT